MQGLLRAGDAKSALPTFAAAGLAGATACAALYPLDVVRSRLMCDTVRTQPYVIVTSRADDVMMLNCRRLVPDCGQLMPDYGHLMP
jgi:hypothetical protein